MAAGTACQADSRDIEKYPPYKFADSAEKQLVNKFTANVFDRQSVYDMCEAYRAIMINIAAKANLDLHKRRALEEFWQTYELDRPKHENAIFLMDLQKARVRRTMLLDIGGKTAVQMLENSFFDKAWSNKPTRPIGHRVSQNAALEKKENVRPLSDFKHFQPEAYPKRRSFKGDFNATIKKRIYNPDARKIE